MKPGLIRGLKALLFFACLVPLGKLALEVFGVAGMSLGANPVEELIHRFGIWGLNFLLITLSVTPVASPDWLELAAPLSPDVGAIRFFLCPDAFSRLCRRRPEI